MFNTLGGPLALGRKTGSGFQDFNAVNSYPITLTADTWTTVVNDGAGAYTNLTYGPVDKGVLMDATTGEIDTSGLNLGDTLLVRNDFRLTPSVNNTSVQFRYRLGTGAGQYYLTNQLGILSNGAGIEYPLQFLGYIYMGDTNTKDNPIGLEINCSAETSFTNLGIVMEALA